MPPQSTRGPKRGVRWVNDDVFRANLVALLEEKTGAQVVAELRAAGITIDVSLLSKLKSGAVPTSAAAGSIATFYGWPIPPMAELGPAQARAVAKLAELDYLDPERAARLEAQLDDALAAARLAKAQKPR
jgi:hypothetical protein